MAIRPSGFPLWETTKALSSWVIPATRTTVPFGIRILAPSLLVTRTVSRVSRYETAEGRKVISSFSLELSQLLQGRSSPLAGARPLTYPASAETQVTAVWVFPRPWRPSVTTAGGQGSFFPLLRHAVAVACTTKPGRVKASAAIKHLQNRLLLSFFFRCPPLEIRLVFLLEGGGGGLRR
jgi:hypothetical protein